MHPDFAINLRLWDQHDKLGSGNNVFLEVESTGITSKAILNVEINKINYQSYVLIEIISVMLMVTIFTCDRILVHDIKI